MIVSACRWCTSDLGTPRRQQLEHAQQSSSSDTTNVGAPPCWLRRSALPIQPSKAASPKVYARSKYYSRTKDSQQNSRKQMIPARETHSTIYEAYDTYRQIALAQYFFYRIRWLQSNNRHKHTRHRRRSNRQRRSSHYSHNRLTTRKIHTHTRTCSALRP